jgi:peroxiredoxin Q/BCP
MAKSSAPATKAPKTGRTRASAIKEPSAAHPLEGKKAPAFTLPNQDGAPVSLRSLVAKGPLALYFYPKDMTPGCTTEACGFRDVIDEIRAIGAQVVGVSPDSPASHQKFIAKHGPNFPLLCDAGNEVAKAYDVYKKKSLYGRQFMGIERTTFIIGGDGKVLKVFPKVKVNGHAADVIEALRQAAK